MTYEEKLKTVSKNIARSLEGIPGASIEEKADFIAKIMTAAGIVKTGEIAKDVEKKSDTPSPFDEKVALRARLARAMDLEDERELISISSDASAAAITYGSLRSEFEEIVQDADDFLDILREMQEDLDEGID